MSPGAAPSRRPAPGAFLLLAGLSLVWGLNWPIMKTALAEIPPLPFRALCLIPAGPTLLAIASLRHARWRLPAREVAPLLLASLFNVTLWYLLSAYALSLMPAGRASILAYTMPAWATLFGALALREPLSPRGVVGLALGMAGIAVLLVPDFHRVLAAPLGALAMLSAAAAWAAGSVVMKRFSWTPPVVALTGWQLTLGGLPVVLAGILIGPFPGLDHVDLAGLGGLVYVVVFGMLFAQWAWFKVLGQLPVAVASLGTLAIPVIGVLSSTFLLGETLGASEATALALVVAALALVLGRR